MHCSIPCCLLQCIILTTAVFRPAYCSILHRPLQTFTFINLHQIKLKWKVMLFIFASERWDCTLIVSIMITPFVQILLLCEKAVLPFYVLLTNTLLHMGLARLVKYIISYLMLWEVDIVLRDILEISCLCWTVFCFLQIDLPCADLFSIMGMLLCSCYVLGHC